MLIIAKSSPGYSLRRWIVFVLLLSSACSSSDLPKAAGIATYTAAPTLAARIDEVFLPTKTFEVSPTLTPSPVGTPEEPASSATPAALPPGIPLLADAREIETGDGRIIYRTGLDAAAVDRFYLEKLPEEGWVLSYRNSLPPGKCPGGNCNPGTGTDAVPEMGLLPGWGQIWVKTGASLQVLLVVGDHGTLVTINIFSE
jgi:hypothetical protein